MEAVTYNDIISEYQENSSDKEDQENDLGISLSEISLRTTSLESSELYASDISLRNTSLESSEIYSSAILDDLNSSVISNKKESIFESDEKIIESLNAIHCRMYQDELPELGAIVMTKVVEITNNYIRCILPEYDDVDALLMFSELTKKRIRSVNQIAKVGVLEPLQVIYIDPLKKYINLSKRNLQPDEITRCENSWKKAKVVHMIVRYLSYSIGVSPVFIYENLIWNHAAKLNFRSTSEKNFGEKTSGEKNYLFLMQLCHISHTLKEPELSLTLEKKFLDQLSRIPNETMSRETIWALINGLIRQINQRIKPDPSLIRSYFSLNTFAPNGIEIIINTLSQAQETFTKYQLEIKLAAVSKYMVSVEAQNKNDGISFLELVLNFIEKKIVEQGGWFKLITVPTVIGSDAYLNITQEGILNEPNDVSNDVLNDVLNDESSDVPNDVLNDVLNDESSDVPNDVLNDESNDESNDEPNDALNNALIYS
jgi:translation initiation factor 2 subunit 1